MAVVNVVKSLLSTPWCTFLASLKLFDMYLLRPRKGCDNIIIFPSRSNVVPLLSESSCDVGDFLGWQDVLHCSFCYSMINIYHDNNWILILIKAVFNGKVMRGRKEHW